MKKIAIFGSGSGSNAENIYNYFSESTDVRVVLICTNKSSAFIVTRAERLKIPVIYTSRADLNNYVKILEIMKNYDVDYIILSGFLLKIPKKIISSYPKKIINIHPSLLPKYGGVGMYGKNVHKAVLENHETKSGITIHFVNANYDEGEIILQKSCSVSNNETLESLEKKIRQLELVYFPKTIEHIILEH